MRSYLKWALAIQFLGWAFLTASAQLPTCPLRPTPGSVVQDQLGLSSQNGALNLGLTIQNAADTYGYMHYCLNYTTSTGIVEAPTLRLNPGDTLTLDLTDQLNVAVPNSAFVKYPMSRMEHATGVPTTDPCKSQIMDFNTTNLHFHGLNVPPVCHQDDVVNTLLQPSTTPFRYQIQIPANEPPGLYWYHPHPHGYTALQVNGGAAGAIIVSGIEKIKPQVAGLTERVFVIRQQFLNPLSWIPGPYQLTLNFQPATYPLNASPIIQMKPGEKQFWRVANASTQAFISLQVLFGTTAQTLELISLDGVPVTGDPMVTSIDVAPAGRAEFIVTGPPTGTTNATFINAGFNTGPVGNANHSQLLANIVPTAGASSAAAGVLPAASVPAVTQRFSGLAAMKPTTQRKLYFSEAALGTNPPVNFFITVEGQQPSLFTRTSRPPSSPKSAPWKTGPSRTTPRKSTPSTCTRFISWSWRSTESPCATPRCSDTSTCHYWDGQRTVSQHDCAHGFPRPEHRRNFRLSLPRPRSTKTLA